MSKKVRPTVKFSKIKIDSKNKIYVELSEHTEKGMIEKKETLPFDPHEDFRKAFKSLVPHLCRFAEQYNKDGEYIPSEYNPDPKKSDDENDDDENKEHMQCRTLSFAGKDEIVSIVITGVRYLTGGKTITVNTPSIPTSYDDETADKDTLDFKKCLDDLKEETLAFLYDGKYAPDVQTKMFDEDQTEGEIA